MFRRICVFCGSSSGVRPIYAEAAAALGRELARRGIGLVFGGGKIGLMGIVADSVMAAGGEVIGVLPKPLFTREVAHTGLTELHVVDSMHARKAMMADLAEGFIAMPGGFGTLEELFEIVTWAQLGLHTNPCGLLNTAGYFDPLVSFIDHQVTEGFLPTEDREIVMVDPDPAGLLERMERYEPPIAPRWITPEET